MSVIITTGNNCSRNFYCWCES